MVDAANTTGYRQVPVNYYLYRPIFHSPYNAQNYTYIAYEKAGD